LRVRAVRLVRVAGLRRGEASIADCPRGDNLAAFLAISRVWTRAWRAPAGRTGARLEVEGPGRAPGRSCGRALDGAEAGWARVETAEVFR